MAGKYLSCGCDIPTTNPSILTSREKAFKSSEDLIGQKFGRRTVLSIDHKELDNINRTHFYLKCRCDCGNEKIVEKIHLKLGNVKSCGCLHNNTKDIPKEFIKSYNAMKSRCDNPNNDHYKYYGGRGISYDPNWKYFNNFKKDMLELYIETKDKNKDQTISIDRIDVNGNYNKDNCKWSTIKEQANNKTNNRKLTLGELTMTASQFIDRGYADPGIDYEIFRNRARNSNKYVTNGIIHNYDIFRNEKFRETLQKPLRKISDEEKEKYNNIVLPKNFIFNNKDDLNNN